MKKFLIGLLAVGLLAFGAVALAQNVAIYTEQGGAKMVIGSGGELEIQSGALLDLQAGAQINSPVEVVAATNVITAAESGATFFLAHATEFVSTLPAPAAGLEYTFIIGLAPSGANYTVVSNGGANVINTMIMVATADDVGDVTVDRDVVTFVGGASVVGDWISCLSDGTSWFCRGGASVAEGITTGQT